MKKTDPNPQRVIQRFVRRVTSRLAAEKAPTPLRKVDYRPIRLDDTHQAAVKSMQLAKPWSHKINELGFAHDVRVHPDMVRFQKRFVKECKDRGIPIRIFEGYRSAERQAALYALGRTKPGKKVTNAKPGSSAHQFGCAVDIIHAIELWDLRQKEWNVLIAIGYEVARKLNIKVENGYKEWGWDAPHWQLVGWKLYRQAEAELASERIQLPSDDAMRFAILDERVKRIKERNAHLSLEGEGDNRRKR